MGNIENIIYEIMVYINLNLFERITLDILSSKFSYSKFHLHRKFKEVAGVTINEYIKRRRIESSIYFLFANPDADISEIADYTGFSSATYSREFKKIFNRSPKEWRNIYKKGIVFSKDSNICKNYQQFICYSDNGIPKEIKKISTIDIMQMNLYARIFYSNYFSAKVQSIWEEIKEHNREGKSFITVPLNSPAVTDPSCCLYLLGFESSNDIPGLNKIFIGSGCYIKIDYYGPRSKFREAFTWIIKYYMPRRKLKYDYRVQFIEYAKIPNLYEREISCKLYIPIIRG